jgi:hypothetical protein
MLKSKSVGRKNAAAPLVRGYRPRSAKLSTNLACLYSTLLQLLTSANGTSRRFAAAQQFGRFRSEADIEPRLPSRIHEYTA